MEQIRQLGAFKGFQREVFVAVLRAFRAWLTEHHFGMLDEIAVDGKAVRGLAKMNPVIVHRNGVIPLLEEDDVRDHIRARVRPESGVGEPDCTEEVSSFGKVFPDFRGLLIHCEP